MRQDIKLKGKLKGYTQTPLMLTLLFAAMDVWMYVLNVKAGILGTIFVAIYFFVMLFVYWRNQPILLNELIDFATQYGTVQKRLLNEFEVPYAVMDSAGKLLWMNHQFELLSEKDKGYHKSITTIFPQVTRELMEKEQIAVEEKALRYVAKAGDGSMRDALSLLDQCIAFYLGQELTFDKVLEVLGTVDTEVFSKLLRKVLEQDVTSCIHILEDLLVNGKELGQFVNDFTWYLRNLLLVKTSEDAEEVLDVSSENLKALQEESQLIDTDTLMRYIRVLSELSNNLRNATQKRVLVELAFIKLTKPQMEHSYDSIIERLNKIEDQLEEGVPVNPSMLAGMTSPVTQMAVSQAVGPTEPEVPREQVALPKAQYEDLELIRNEWGKIVRTLGGVIRSSFRDTVVEPSGEGCLCVVFASVDNFEIGRRPTIMGELEQYVKNTYGKDIYFKARLMGTGERMDTVYVSDEELRERIHMDIAIEEE